ncbi:MAG: hypothetical protein R3B39_02905 [Candidatus Paceibacterota bacterium]
MSTNKDNAAQSGPNLKKKAPRKKPTIKKVGHRKIKKMATPRKRFPELRLPRGGSKKTAVVMIFRMLNSFSAKDRADCLNALAPYTQNKEKRTSQIDPLVAKLKKIILDQTLRSKKG